MGRKAVRKKRSASKPAGIRKKSNASNLAVVPKRILKSRSIPRERESNDSQIFREMVNANPDRMSIADVLYIYREVNPAYLESYGCTRDEIVGRHIADILGRDIFEQTVKPRYDECLTGKQVRYQSWFEFRSGRQFLDVIYNPHFGADGQVDGVIVTARDCTTAQLAREALQFAEDCLNLISSSVDDVVWLADGNTGKMLFVSAAYERVWGRSLQDAYDDPNNWIDAVHPADRSRLDAEMVTLSEQGRIDTEYRINRPDGEVRWIHDVGAAVFDVKNQVLRHVGIAQDVTETKRAQHALDAERRRLKAFLTNSLVNAWMKDEDGRYVYFSEQTEDCFELGEERWKGKTDFDLFPAETADGLRRNDLAVLKSGQAMEAVEKITKSDGGVSWWLSNKFPFQDENGKRYVGGLAVDITRMRWAEEERQKFVLLANQSHEFIGMCDCQFKPIYVNPAGCQLVGLDSSEAVSRTKVPDYFFPEDLPWVMDEMFPRAQREGHVEMEIRFRHFKTRQPIWMLYHLFSLHDLNSEPVGWAAVGHDITERKQAEEARRRLEEKEAHAQKLEALGMLAAGMAHDVNTLFTVILGNAQLVQSQMQRKDLNTTLMHEELTAIVEAVDRGKTFLDKLLTLGRIRSSKLSSIDLNVVVKDTLSVIRPIVGTKIVIDCRLASDLRYCVGDSLQMHQVVMNLIKNSIDAMPRGGTLTIQTENAEPPDDSGSAPTGPRRSSHISLIIRDTGIGMDPRTMENLFVPYYSTKFLDKGTGLGLSIVYAIVKQAGGQITVDSEIGKGTTFRIFLPTGA